VLLNDSKITKMISGICFTFPFFDGRIHLIQNEIEIYLHNLKGINCLYETKLFKLAENLGTMNGLRFLIDSISTSHSSNQRF